MCTLVKNGITRFSEVRDGASHASSTSLQYLMSALQVANTYSLHPNKMLNKYNPNKRVKLPKSSNSPPTADTLSIKLMCYEFKDWAHFPPTQQLKSSS